MFDFTIYGTVLMYSKDFRLTRSEENHGTFILVLDVGLKREVVIRKVDCNVTQSCEPFYR